MFQETVKKRFIRAVFMTVFNCNMSTVLVFVSGRKTLDDDDADDDDDDDDHQCHPSFEGGGFLLGLNT